MTNFAALSLSVYLMCIMPLTAQAGEKATYVGEGRYSCSSDSVDCAVLRQRNNELSIRQQERQETERRYERAERREREYERDRQQYYESNRY